MVAHPPNASPRLSDLPQSAEERFVALDCASLFAPVGPIPLDGVQHCRFDGLTAAGLHALGPTTVILPLFSAEHDAMTMVETLQEFGFSGRILVIAPHLPRPQLVERELRAAGPGARLMLVSP
jgi:hypothetical protein